MQFRGGMQELLRQASRIQRKVDETREQFKTRTFEVTGANGQITVVANGGRELVSIKVDPALFQGDSAELASDAIVATVNAAFAKAHEALEAEIEKLTGGIKIPGVSY